MMVWVGAILLIAILFTLAYIVKCLIAFYIIEGFGKALESLEQPLEEEI